MFKELFILLYMIQLDNILDQVISIRILDKVFHILYYLICEQQFLLLPAFFQTSLNYAATMFVFAYLNHVLAASVEDKSRTFICHGKRSGI